MPITKPPKFQPLTLLPATVAAPDLRRRLESASARRKLSLAEAIREAVAEWCDIEEMEAKPKRRRRVS